MPDSTEGVAMLSIIESTGSQDYLNCHTVSSTGIANAKNTM